MAETKNERVERILNAAVNQRFRNPKTDKEIFVTAADHSLNELEYRYVGTKTLRRMNISKFVNKFDRVVSA
jgi:hypothetical protein